MWVTIPSKSSTTYDVVSWIEILLLHFYKECSKRIKLIEQNVKLYRSQNNAGESTYGLIHGQEAIKERKDEASGYFFSGGAADPVVGSPTYTLYAS